MDIQGRGLPGFKCFLSTCGGNGVLIAPWSLTSDWHARVLASSHGALETARLSFKGADDLGTAPLRGTPFRIVSILRLTGAAGRFIGKSWL